MSKQYYLSKEEVFDRIDKINDLPKFPVVVEKINEKMRNPDFGIGDLAPIIESDPSLSLRILKLANSPFYSSLSGKISSVQQALVRLGIGEVKNVCLTFGALNLFVNPSGLISLNDFWSHCISCALMAQEIVRKKGIKGVKVNDQNTIYTGGLLHELGAFILDQYFHDIYERIRGIAQESERRIFEVEKEILGVDHAAICARLLQRWNLPVTLQNIVQYHHNPDLCPDEDKKLCQILHIADFIVTSHGLFEPGDVVIDQCSEGAWHDLDLKVEDMPELLDTVDNEVERSKTLLGITKT